MAETVLAWSTDRKVFFVLVTVIFNKFFTIPFTWENYSAFLRHVGREFTVSFQMFIRDTTHIKQDHC